MSIAPDYIRQRSVCEFVQDVLAAGRPWPRLQLAFKLGSRRRDESGSGASCQGQEEPREPRALPPGVLREYRRQHAGSGVAEEASGSFRAIRILIGLWGRGTRSDLGFLGVSAVPEGSNSV